MPSGNDYLNRMRKKQGLAPRIPPTPKPAEPPPQRPIARPPEALTGQPLPAAKPPPKGGKPGVRPPKPPPPIIGYNKDLKRSCGHQEDYPIYKGEKPDWEANRRKKWLGKICKLCVEARTQREIEEAKQIRKEKRKKSMGEPGWREKAAGHLERLPNGSMFTDLVYHDGKGDEKKWTGRLEVPVEGIDSPVVFQGENHALFKLLASLDIQYREWLDKRQKEREPNAEPT